MKLVTSRFIVDPPVVLAKLLEDFAENMALVYM
jgi:hypothetical protein